MSNFMDIFYFIIKMAMDILKETIKQSKPSVPLSELQKYARIKALMDGKVEDPKKQERPKIGFT